MASHSDGTHNCGVCVQCRAALHAKLCGGEYVNPQNGLQHSGVEAVEAAKKEIAEYLPHGRKYGGLISHPFPGWEASR